MGLPANTTTTKLFWTLNALLGVAVIGEMIAPKDWPILDAATLVLATIASIAALNRQLPLQNVLPAALIAALIGGVAHGLSGNLNIGIPFGPLHFNPEIGEKIPYFVPWPILLVWIIVIFNARGLARLILRPWRKVKNYGFWLIGLTGILVMAFDFAFEPFATHVKHFWFWQPTKISVTWFGASPLSFLGWGAVSLLILAFATPSLIKKQPGRRSTPDFHSFALWLGALLWFAVGSARAGLWWPVGVDAAIAAVTAVFAIRGAKW